jgi:hypothetical protein
MCKTFETSLATFVFSLTCVTLSIHVRKTKEVYFASIVILTFSLIQLVDAGIWWSITHKNKLLNNIISRYAVPFILASELLVSYFGIKYMFGWSNRYFEYGLFIFASFILLTWVFRYCKDTNAYTVPYADGYLHWCGLDLHTVVRILFILFLLTPIVIGLPSKYNVIKYLIIVPIIATFVMNYMNVTFGARWCWSSNITSLLLLGYSMMY